MAVLFVGAAGSRCLAPAALRRTGAIVGVVISMLSRPLRGTVPGERAEPAVAPAAATGDRFYRRLTQAMCAGYLATAIGITAAAALFVLHSRDERIAAATAQSLTLTRSLDEHVRRTLAGVDVVLGIVAADIVAHGGVTTYTELDLHNELKRKRALLPQANSMFVYRSDLQLHAGSGFYPVPRVDGSKLMHVNTHLDAASTSLLVGKPLMSPVAKRWTIPVTRRISGADGTLAGVAGAIIDPSHFDAFYRELDLAPGMGLALLRDSGELLFRFPQVAALGPGTDLSKSSPVFELALPLQAPVTLRYATPHDGVERFITFRRVGDLGVMVAASHEVQALLAPWRRDAIALGAGVAAALAALTVLLWVALLQIRRRAAAERAHHDTLEAKVRERTAELETANEELEAFSYSASHDLRSPLHAMSGLMFLLRRDRDSTLSPKRWTCSTRARIGRHDDAADRRPDRPVARLAPGHPRQPGRPERAGARSRRWAHPAARRQPDASADRARPRSAG